MLELFQILSREPHSIYDIYIYGRQFCKNRPYCFSYRLIMCIRSCSRSNTPYDSYIRYAGKRKLWEKKRAERTQIERKGGATTPSCPEPNRTIDPSLPASHPSPLLHLSLSASHFSLLSRDEPEARSSLQIGKSTNLCSPSLYRMNCRSLASSPAWVLLSVGIVSLSLSLISLAWRRISLSPLDLYCGFSPEPRASLPDFSSTQPGITLPCLRNKTVTEIVSRPRTGIRAREQVDDGLTTFNYDRTFT